MALEKCRECDNMISTSAKVCPKCGAKRPGSKFWMWAIFVLITPLFLLVIFAPDDPQGREARDFARAVQSMMRDPGSFDVVELRVSSSGAVCLTYRAKNAFNAYVQQRAVRTPEGRTDIQGVLSSGSELWIQHCSNGSGKRYTFL